MRSPSQTTSSAPAADGRPPGGSEGWPTPPRGVPSWVSRPVRWAQQELRYGSEVVWRYGLNRASYKEFRQRPPALGAVARGVLRDLEQRGVATASLTDLTGDGRLLAALQELAARLEAEQAGTVAARRLALTGAGQQSPRDKPFVVELLDLHRPVVRPDDVLATVGLHAQLRGIADAYFGVRTRIADVNIWRSLASSRPAASSQLWHRDLKQDRYVLKLFIYLEDVDDDAGPFSYLAGTHCKGADRRLRLPGQTRDRSPRAPEDSPAAAGRSAAVLTVTGRAGTVVFADTLGFHRGGHARSRDRLVCQVLYSSPAADGHRMLGLPAGVDADAYAADLAYDAR